MLLLLLLLLIEKPSLKNSVKIGWPADNDNCCLLKWNVIVYSSMKHYPEINYHSNNHTGNICIAKRHFQKITPKETTMFLFIMHVLVWILYLTQKLYILRSLPAIIPRIVTELRDNFNIITNTFSHTCHSGLAMLFHMSYVSASAMVHFPTKTTLTHIALGL